MKTNQTPRPYYIMFAQRATRYSSDSQMMIQGHGILCMISAWWQEKAVIYIVLYTQTKKTTTPHSMIILNA